ncbi:MAG: DUF2069 domain-containing protein [Burkholderiales bacterium]|nr:DUF2069 domain-containing protein [Burkholderiales bacterium]
MRALYLLANACLLLLIALSVAWEAFLAPLRPGGSWMVLKAIPLLIPLRGILRANRYTCQWASFLALAYFVEGVVRAFSDPFPSRYLAAVEIVLAVMLFLSLIFLARGLERQQRYGTTP